MTGQPERVAVTVGIRDTAAQDRALDAPTRRRGLGRVAIAFAGLAVAGVALWPAASDFTSADRSVPRSRLRMEPINVGPFVRDVAVRGRVVAAVKPTVYAPDEGIVTLMVEAGASVSEGELLARIDSPELASELEQERSTLMSLETRITRQEIETRKLELANRQAVDLARVDIVAAARELRRAEAAWANRLISRQDFEKARDDLETAKLEYEHSRQRKRLESESLAFELKTWVLDRDRQRLVVTELERRVTGLAVRSPVNGMVGLLAVDQKSAVARSQPLMTVVDLSAYEIEIQVPQEYGDDLGQDMPAEILIGKGIYGGRIRSVSPEVSDNQVTARIRFDDDLPAGLRQNQRVSARLILEERADALLVSRGPFLDSGGGRIAYVVDGNLAHRRSIKTGAVSTGQVEILDGLGPGEVIVISDLGPFDKASTVLLTD